MAQEIPLCSLGPEEIAECRAEADRMPWLQGRKAHALLDALDDLGEALAETTAQAEKITELEETVSDLRAQLQRTEEKLATARAAAKARRGR